MPRKRKTRQRQQHQQAASKRKNAKDAGRKKPDIPRDNLFQGFGKVNINEDEGVVIPKNISSKGTNNSTDVAKPCGLINLGNTCFFNATLQVLCRSPELSAMLDARFNEGIEWSASNSLRKEIIANLRSYYGVQPDEESRFASDEINSSAKNDDCEGAGVNDNDDFSEGGYLVTTLPLPSKLTYAYINIVRKMRSSKSPILAGELLNRLSEKYHSFCDRGQHDSHELLRCLLDCLRRDEIRRQRVAVVEALNIPTNPEGEYDNAARDLVRPYNQASRFTTIDALFGGYILSWVTCQECQSTSMMLEYFVDLMLPVSDDKCRFASSDDDDCADKSSRRFGKLLDDLPRLTGRARRRTDLEKVTSTATSTALDADETLCDNFAKMSTKEGEDTLKEQGDLPKCGNIKVCPDKLSLNEDGKEHVQSEGVACEGSTITTSSTALNADDALRLRDKPTQESSKDDETFDIGKDSLLGELENSLIAPIDELKIDLPSDKYEETFPENVNEFVSELVALRIANEGIRIDCTDDSSEYISESKSAGSNGDDITLESKISSSPSKGNPFVDDPLLDPNFDDLVKLGKVSHTLPSSEPRFFDDVMPLLQSDERLNNSAAADKKEALDCHSQCDASLTARNNESFQLPTTGASIDSPVASDSSVQVLDENGSPLESSSSNRDDASSATNSHNSSDVYIDESGGAHTRRDESEEEVFTLSKPDPDSKEDVLKAKKSEKRRAASSVECFTPSENKAKSDWLSLPLCYRKSHEGGTHDSTTLYNCLAKFTAPELLAGSNKIICSNCSKNYKAAFGIEKKIHTNASKQMLIALPPPLLTIQLKRFELDTHRYMNFKKINKQVSFPLRLNLSAYVSRMYFPLCTALEMPVSSEDYQHDDQNAILYELYGVIIHSGTMRSGHYTSCVKISSKDRKSRTGLRKFIRMKPFVGDVSDLVNNCDITRHSEVKFSPNVGTTNRNTYDESERNENGDDARWYFCDDSSVSLISLREVLKSQAYILFYERIQ